MSLAYITWTVNPEIFSTSYLSPRWYGLLFAAGFYFGILIMKRIYLLEKVEEIYLDKITWYMVIGTIIGARLGHVFFYGPYFGSDGYLSNPVSILKIWEGGLASHGAAIGILVALALFQKYSGIQKSFLWVVDRIVITVALGAFFIRLGNLMNHEIVGIPSTLPWAFIFQGFPSFSFPDGIPRHPAQLYEALAYLATFFLLVFIYKKLKDKTPKGMLFGIFLICVFTARFFLEFIKENQVSFENEMTLNMGQILSIPLVIIGLFFLFWSKKNRENIQSTAE